MSIRLTITAVLLAALSCNLSSAQQFGGTTPGGGGSPAGGGVSVNSFTTPSTSTGSSTSGMSSSGGGGNAAGGNAAFGTTVISRPGFLAPSEKLGFLTPSNTSAIPTSGRTGTTTGITGINSRLGGLSGLGGLGGLGGFGNQMGMNNRSGTTGTTQLRIPMKVASNQAVNAPAQIAVATRFTERVTKLPGLQTLDVTMTAVEGRTAVLRGKVASKEQGELIGRLALLEPGISSVRNELTVDPTLVSSEKSPAGK